MREAAIFYCKAVVFYAKTTSSLYRLSDVRNLSPN